MNFVPDMTAPIASLIIPYRIQPGADWSQMINALLASLPDRPDIEVLLIDDGSSLPYAHPTFTALQIHRLTLQGQGQSGVGVARNLGMDEALGEWLLFADSDDLLNGTGLTVLLDGLSAGSWSWADLLVPRASSFRDGDTSQSGSRHLFANRRVERARRLNDPDSLVRLPACWMRVVRRDFVRRHGLRFGGTSIAEDVDFAVDLGLAHPQTALVDLVLPRIREGHNSLTSDMGVEAWVEVLAVKTAANTRLRAGGLARWEYPLLLDLLGLTRRNPRAGLLWWKRALTNRDRLLPSLRDMWHAAWCRLSAQPADDVGS